jgi:hypothetical protein
MALPLCEAATPCSLQVLTICVRALHSRTHLHNECVHARPCQLADEGLQLGQLLIKHLRVGVVCTCAWAWAWACGGACGVAAAAAGNSRGNSVRQSARDPPPTHPTTCTR